jgi:hypothetical protein
VESVVYHGGQAEDLALKIRWLTVFFTFGVEIWFLRRPLQLNFPMLRKSGGGFLLRERDDIHRQLSEMTYDDAGGRFAEGDVPRPNI